MPGSTDRSRTRRPRATAVSGRTGDRTARRATIATLTTIALTLAGVGPALAAVSPTVAPASVAPAAASTLTGESVASPDGSLVATLATVDGRLTYDVVRDGSTTVVAPSGLGFTLSDPVVDLTTGMTITSVERRTADESWTPAWGTDSRIRNHYDELVAHALHEASGVRLDVTIRVFDDGFGLRYTFPQQAVLGAFNVTNESTQFTLPASATAYYIKSGTDWNADEAHYITTALTNVATAQTPITMTSGSDLVLSVHEADLTDFPSMTLVKDATTPAVPGRLVSSLIALPGGLKAVLDVTSEPFSTPWRTINVGRTAGDLAESHLIENLNDECAICDVDSDDDGVDDTTDWITPANYTGVWWELQRRATTWTAGVNHGATTARTKAYIDLAASSGAKFVLAEGWNVNAGVWTNQDFLTPMADFDLPEVLSYAASKGVGFIAHNETRGYVDLYEQQMEGIFTQYEAWGIHAIKTGYATRFLLGGVQRSHADQEAVRHYQRVIEAAARHHITIDAHEAIKPTGLARTFPNMMTGEGISGMEQENYKGAAGNPPEQKTILPFTRYMGGPADYTPGVLNVTWDPANQGTRVQSTVANQLALYTTFFSPMQMFADTPENYAENAEAFTYLKDIPTTWDESHVPDAVIGDYTVTQRRSGSTWYMGVVTDENDRTLAIPLDFLTPGTTYVADIYADAAATTWKGNPKAIDVTHQLVDSTDTLRASVVGGGGQAVKFRVATTEEIATVPALAPAQLSVVGAVSSSYDTQSRTATVRATVKNDGSEVSSVRLYVDGTLVEGVSARLDSGTSGSIELKLPADSIPYAAEHTLTFGNGVDAPTASSTVTLVPFPTEALAGSVALLTQSGGINAELGGRIGQLLTEAVALAEAGDLPGVELKMQSVRLAAGSASAADLSGPAFTALEQLVAPWLGDASGLPGLLSGIRAAQSAGLITPDVADLLRQDGAEATRAAIRGDGATRVAALSRLAASTGAVDTGNVLTALRAQIATQRSAPVVLQAETSTLTGGASVSTEHAGYTGTGFVKNLTKLDACVTFPTTGIADGRYTVTARFGNGMIIVPLDRELTLTVGTARTKLFFANQGQDDLRWKRWATTTGYPVTFRAGDPVSVCFAADDSGNINLDQITFTPATGVIVRTDATERPTVAIATDPATPDGTNGWWHESPTVQVEADGPDSATGEVKIGDGAWLPSGGGVTLPTEGVHHLRARAVTDDDLSAEATLDVKIDGTAPVSVATVDETARTVSVRAADDVSGVDRIEVRTDAGSAFEEYTGPVVVGSERTTLSFRAVDRAGNIEASYDVVVPRTGGDPLTPVVNALTSDEAIELGKSARISVRVAGSAAAPTGWVEVVEDGSVLLRSDLDDGRVTAVVPGLGVGDHDLTVRYGGDAAYDGALTSVFVTVRAASSKLALVLPKGQVELGSVARVEAHVSGAGVKAGDTVRFSVAGAEVGAAQVDAQGVAAWLVNTSKLPVGQVVVAARLVATTTTLASDASGTFTVHRTPTRVTLSAPALSAAKAVYNDSRRAVTASTTVNGATSGTVTFRSGTRVLGTAPVRAGRATVTLPRTLPTGTYRVVASLAATSSTLAGTSPSSAKLTVSRTAVKTLKVSGKKYTKGKTVAVTVKISTTTTNGRATAGSVKVLVGSKTVKTISLATLRKNKGTVTVKLPSRYATSKSIKVRATYVPSDKANVSAKTSTTVTLKRR